MTEAQFQAQVIDLAKMAGWLVHAERPAQTGRGWRTPIQGHAGYPDLTLTRGGHVRWAELKIGRNKPSPEQARWIAALGADVWYPADLELIITELTARD